MSASADRDPVYLDVEAIAHRIGVKRKSVSEFARRGDMPEPDLVWLGRRLWLVETVDAWRRQRYMRREKRPMLRRRDVAPPSTVPKLAPGARPAAAMPRGNNARPSRRKSSSVGALQRPVQSSVSEQLAGEIAAALRAEGHYCTTADVMVLADADADSLEHERRVLQQRIRQKLR